MARVITRLVLANGSPSSTAVVTLDASADGVNWMLAAKGTRRGAAGSHIEILSAPLLAHHRARVDLDGDTPFEVTAFSVDLLD